MNPNGENVPSIPPSYTSSTPPPTSPSAPLPKSLKITVIIGSVFFLLLSLASGIILDHYFINPQPSSNSAPVSLPTIPPVSISPTTDLTANWKTYRSEKLGLEFKYPNNLSFEENETSPGPVITGHKFTVSLYQNKKLDDFQIGAVTSDFSAGRGGMFTDTQGYVEESGKLYCLFINNKLEFNSDSIIRKSQNNNGVPMVLITGKKGNQSAEEAGEFVCTNPGEGYLGVLININGPTYRGVGILYNTRSEILTREQFNQILQTFKFIN